MEKERRVLNTEIEELEVINNQILKKFPICWSFLASNWIFRVCMKQLSGDRSVEWNYKADR